MSNVQETILKRYCNYYSRLSLENVDELAELVEPDFKFSDPFHQVANLETTIKALKSMYRVADKVEFDFDECFEINSIAYLKWKCQLIKEAKIAYTLTGVSRIEISASGLIKEHVDYWDAASQLYENLPFIGFFIRLIRKKISASQQ